MNKTLLLLTAAICISACNTTDTTNSSRTLSAEATIDPRSKTSYSDSGAGAGIKVDWADEESFRAFYGGTTSYITFNKSEAGITFSAESVPDGVTTETSFKGLYGTAASFNSSGKIQISFSGQDGSLENLAAYDVMLAESGLVDNCITFPFHHKCAILRVKIQNKYAASYTGKDVKQLNLVFKNALIDEDFASGCLGTYSYSTKAFWVNFKNLDVPPQTTKTYYFAVPAMKYIYDSSTYDSIGLMPDNTVAKTISFNTTNKKGLVAGKVYDISLTFETVQPE